MRDQLAPLVPRVFMPLLRRRAPRRRRLTCSVGPLFPCYLFVYFSLKERYYDVRYLPGVNGIVSAGRDPIAVPDEIVIEIEQRGSEGVIELAAQPFAAGENVRIAAGPLSGFEGVFERYLSGHERVAILLQTVESAGVRVILPAAALALEAPASFRG